MLWHIYLNTEDIRQSKHEIQMLSRDYYCGGTFELGERRCSLYRGSRGAPWKYQIEVASTCGWHQADGGDEDDEDEDEEDDVGNEDDEDEEDEEDDVYDEDDDDTWWKDAIG